MPNAGKCTKLMAPTAPLHMMCYEIRETKPEGYIISCIPGDVLTSVTVSEPTGFSVPNST